MLGKKDKKPKPWENPAPIELPDDYVQESDTGDATPDAAPDGDYTLAPLPAGADVALDRPRKKKKARTVIILLLVLLVAGVLLANYIINAMKGPAPTYAEFQTVSHGDIQQKLTTSGVLTSGETITVHSPVSAPLLAVNAEVGRPVTAGSPLFTFDLTELERGYRTANSSNRLGNLQAQEAQQKSNDSQRQVDEAQNSINTMQEQRDIAKQRVVERQAEADRVNEKVGPKLAKAQGKLAEAQAAYNVTGDPALLNDIKKYEQEVSQYNGQIQAAATALQEANADVEYHNNIIAQLEGARDSAKAGVMDGTQRAQLSEQNVTNKVGVESAAEQLERARQGVTAPISGVVTQLTVEEGGLASQYGPMCVIESLDKVDVVLSLSRYDLEQVKEGQLATVETLGNVYSGTVSKINSMATEVQTTSGTSSYVSATISLANPDSNIRLGIDANVDIDTGKAEDVLMVPLNAVNTDVNGTYCFVVTPDNIAERREVETGLSNESDIEIISGVSAGEKVILSSQNIVAGTRVSDDPQYITAENAMMGIM